MSDEQFNLLTWTPPEPKGDTYVPERDQKRLGVQCLDVLNLMIDGQFRTLSDISEATGHPEASVSARLRDLRREGFIVDRQYIRRGLHRYRVSKAFNHG